MTPTPATDVEITKGASESTAQTGDTVTYTITLNVIGKSASNVQVQDTLPAHMNFVSFGAVPAGGTSSFMGPGTLTWNWASLAPGSYSFTYQVKIDSYVSQGTVFTNRAQLTYTGWPTAKIASVDVKIAVAYTVRVGVYNEAGELVKEIWVQQLSQAVVSFSIAQSPNITGLHTPVTVMYQGKPIATWDGTNGVGDPVTNGNYYLKVDNVDPYGVVTTVSEVIKVNRSLAKIQVDIFNEAGEVVRHLYSYVDDANNGQLTGMQLSTNVVMAGSDINTVSNPGEVVVTLSTGATLVWDGRNDQGQVVTNGHYELEVHMINGKGAESVISKGILVQNDNQGPGKVYAKPNILNKGNYTTTITLNTTMSLTLKVRVYDVAGELIKTIEGSMGQGTATLDANGLASGLYFAVVDLTDSATGHYQGRQVVQIVIQR
jgi:uncharacterized repeat protein (TIGR01451 family)